MHGRKGCEHIAFNYFKGQNQVVSLVFGNDRNDLKNILNDEDLEFGSELGCTYILVSSIDLDISGIVPYFTNEDRIEQIFGLSKTNDMLKPIENPTIDHLRGHALINFLATCTHMGIDSHFDETELLAKNAFFSLCLLTATLKSTKLCVSEPNESMNEYLKILNIPIPKPMYLKNNSCVDGNYYNL